MYTIHMLPDGRVQLIDKRKTSHNTRYVALESLVSVFSRQSLASPTLPPGCIQHWRGGGYQAVALQKPAHERTMQMYEDTYTLPIPDTLFLYRIQGDTEHELKLTESAVFAMKGPWSGLDTDLYDFPFGNVFDDRTICWGDYDVKLRHFHHLDMVAEMFLGTPFNTDLAGMYDDGYDESANLIDFWNDVKDQKTFPMDRLHHVCKYSEVTTLMADHIFD
ncbi:MAG: hypothetical protein EP343_05985 [Deltaproteobacteria bacterium]|nr:MAG: hypothetical protein EP343_05985 [Deltaproteobacteria bacterium]